MRIVFLHIPKTAGQSVHAALESCFPQEAICPARINDQLALMSIAELSRYRVFSGHLDWSLLDAVPGPKYVFTVLREPMDRLLSFYFYLRRQAEALSSAALAEPQNRGLRAALTYTPRQFFVDGEAVLREFLDTHFDNVYAYVFGGRHFEARRILRPAIDSGALDQRGLVQLAMSNLSRLDDVYAVSEMPRLLRTVEALSGHSLPPGFDDVRNRNEALGPESRRAALDALGADRETFDRIAEFVAMDRDIWDAYAPSPSPSPSDSASR